MNTVIAWFAVGSPPHWQVLCVGAYVAIEYYLPRTKAVRGNSALEVLANLLVRIPLVGMVAVRIGTPPKAEQEQAETRRDL